MTKDKVVIASDSKVTNEKNNNEKSSKIFQITSDLVAYGVGNRYIVLKYFDILQKAKEYYNGDIHYDDVLQIQNDWKNIVERDPVFSGQFGAIGICSVEDNNICATTILVDAKDHFEYQNITRPNNDLSFYILPPSDLTNEFCNSMFKSHLLPTLGEVYLETLICSCADLIHTLSQISSVLDNQVQYWAYDCKRKITAKKLIESLPEEFSS